MSHSITPSEECDFSKMKHYFQGIVVLRHIAPEGELWASTLPSQCRWQKTFYRQIRVTWVLREGEMYFVFCVYERISVSYNHWKKWLCAYVVPITTTNSISSSISSKPTSIHSFNKVALNFWLLMSWHASSTFVIPQHSNPQLTEEVLFSSSHEKKRELMVPPTEATLHYSREGNSP